MNCYDCDTDDRPAVAICCLCGKGLCREHCVRLERRVLRRIAAGMASQTLPTGRWVPRMLCRECAEAVGGEAVGGAVEVE